MDTGLWEFYSILELRDNTVKVIGSQISNIFRGEEKEEEEKKCCILVYGIKR